MSVSRKSAPSSRRNSNSSLLLGQQPRMNLGVLDLNKTLSHFMQNLDKSGMILAHETKNQKRYKKAALDLLGQPFKEKKFKEIQQPKEKKEEKFERRPLTRNNSTEMNAVAHT
jgi:hypothetical protein